jgi:hypothetical protein
VWRWLDGGVQGVILFPFRRDESKNGTAKTNVCRAIYEFNGYSGQSMEISRLLFAPSGLQLKVCETEWQHAGRQSHRQHDCGINF